MLQSMKRAEVQAKPEARPGTQAFVTAQPHALTEIAVGDVAHRHTRRGYDATLLGLAPPPVHVAVPELPARVEPREAQPVAADDRSLSLLLVLGTLVAMFSIAFTAVPEQSPKAAQATARPIAAAPVRPAEKQPVAAAGVVVAGRADVVGPPSPVPPPVTRRATKVTSRASARPRPELTPGDKAPARRRPKPGRT